MKLIEIPVKEIRVLKRTDKQLEKLSAEENTRRKIVKVISLNCRSNLGHMNKLGVI